MLSTDADISTSRGLDPTGFDMFQAWVGHGRRVTRWQLFGTSFPARISRSAILRVDRSDGAGREGSRAAQRQRSAFDHIGEHRPAATDDRGVELQPVLVDEICGDERAVCTPPNATKPPPEDAFRRRTWSAPSPAASVENTSSAAISTSGSPKRFNGAKNSKNSVHSRPRDHARRDRPGDRMSHHEVAVKVVHEYRFQSGSSHSARPVATPW